MDIRKNEKQKRVDDDGLDEKMDAQKARHQGESII